MMTWTESFVFGGESQKLFTFYGIFFLNKILQNVENKIDAKMKLVSSRNIRHQNTSNMFCI